MLTYLLLYFKALLSLVSDLWLFFLIGFVTAGAVSVFVPKETLLRLFGKNNLATLGRATVAGMLTSICSCGAIPLSVTLRKKGATQAAALTFLLAAPWAGFIQLFIFYRFLGLPQTLLIFIGSLTVAFATGIALSYMEKRGWLSSPPPANNPHSNPVPLTESIIPNSALRIADGAVCDIPHSEFYQKVWQKIVKVGKESWEAFRELWKFLTFGLLLAALLSAFIPEDWVTRYLGSDASFDPLLTAVPLAVAIELCSEGFSIFAGQLARMGAILPVIFVVVLVGVTTDFTEISVIWGKFGRKTALLYLATATLLTLLVGHLLWLIL